MKKDNNELFPEENILTKEIESWKDFADSLNSQEYKELFNKMLNDCYKYAVAINAKEREPFPNTTESLIMALRQQLWMKWSSHLGQSKSDDMIRDFSISLLS